MNQPQPGSLEHSAAPANERAPQVEEGRVFPPLTLPFPAIPDMPLYWQVGRPEPVGALEIADVTWTEDGSCVMSFLDDSVAPRSVPGDWFTAPSRSARPGAGMMLVVLGDAWWYPLSRAEFDRYFRVCANGGE